MRTAGEAESALALAAPQGHSRSAVCDGLGPAPLLLCAQCWGQGDSRYWCTGSSTHLCLLVSSPGLLPFPSSKWCSSLCAHTTSSIKEDKSPAAPVTAPEAVKGRCAQLWLPAGDPPSHDSWASEQIMSWKR